MGRQHHRPGRRWDDPLCAPMCRLRHAIPTGHLGPGRSTLPGVRPMVNNIDADTILRAPMWDDTITYHWLKRGQIVHELTITFRQYLNQKYEWCVACLMWRGQLIEVSLKHTSGFRQCPECKGLSIPEHLCTCGESPHRVSCPMGYHLYFLLQEIS